MALTSAFATVQAAPSLDAEFRFRGVYFPDAEPDQDGGRAVARLGLRDPSFLGASLRADVVARASDTSWDRGEVVEPGEIHLTWFGDAGLLRIGRQQIAWGRADAFRLLDVVNPQRYPDALFDDPADARIPLWMVNLEGTTGDLQWQAIAGYDRQLGAADPAWPQFRVDPDPSPENEGEAHLLGVRTSVLVGMTDMGLYWLDSPDYQPPWRPDNQGRLRQVPVRRQLWGFSADRPFGPVVLRIEVTHTESETLDAALQTVTRRLTQGLVGLDLQQGAWFISPQLYRELESPPAYADARRYRTFGSLLIQRALMQDRLNLRAFWLHGLDSNEDWLSLRTSYYWNDLLEWRLDLDRFETTPEGELSPFEGADRISLEAVLRF